MSSFFPFFIGSQTDWKQSADILSFVILSDFFPSTAPHTNHSAFSARRNIHAIFVFVKCQFYYCIFLPPRPRQEVESTDPKTTQSRNQPQLHILSCPNHGKRCCNFPALTYLKDSSTTTSATIMHISPRFCSQDITP